MCVFQFFCVFFSGWVFVFVRERAQAFIVYAKGGVGLDILVEVSLERFCA